MTKAWDPGEYYDDEITVCIAHLCFVPCRKDTVGVPHRHSTDTKDVEAVRRYQQYKEGHPNDVGNEEGH